MKPPSKMEQKSLELSAREDQLWEEWFESHDYETLGMIHETIVRRVSILDQMTGCFREVTKGI